MIEAREQTFSEGTYILLNGILLVLIRTHKLHPVAYDVYQSVPLHNQAICVSFNVLFCFV